MLNESVELDLDLVAEVKRGNKQAFDALVIKYQYKIAKIVGRYVADPSEALDVTQETFIKAYQALPQFRGDSAFYTWLYRIAINTAKNYVVARGRRVPGVDLDIMELEQLGIKNNDKDYSTPERLLICDEMETILHRMINDLPSELKTTIMLRELEGLTYDEISLVMGCPVGTVRSRIFRAREAIEKRINLESPT